MELSKTVSMMHYGKLTFEIDQLLDQLPYEIYHLYLMDSDPSNPHGEHIGFDFTSVAEAKEYAQKLANGQDVDN